MNRKDRAGNNVFEGGFLGLDNIGVFDRSAPLPTGGYLEQADGTAWMALFSQNMLEIAIELAVERPGLRGHGSKFFEHFLWIALAMDRCGRRPECGMRKTDSSTTSCSFPMDARAHEGSLDCGAAAAVRSHGIRGASCAKNIRRLRLKRCNSSPAVRTSFARFTIQVATVARIDSWPRS